MVFRSLLILCAAILGTSQMGCLLNHSRHSVLRQGEPLRALTFESEDARARFEACAEQQICNDDDESSCSFGIPFIIGLEKTCRTSRSALRNDVATEYDINGDGHISDYEVSLHE